jgi:hypothetical protein
VRRGTFIGAVSLLVLFATSCVGQAAGGTVNVAVREWQVAPDQNSIRTGSVSFVVTNEGAETHELLVVEADSADQLPVDADGAFDEAAYGADKLKGEVEDIASTTQKSFSLDLQPGNYLLLCNVVDEEASGEKDAHFSHGMYAAFTVEP